MTVTTEVSVFLKKEVLDPESRAARELITKDYADELKAVAVSKTYKLTFEGLSKEEALKKSRHIAEEVLCNNVSHQFTVT